MQAPATTVPLIRTAEHDSAERRALQRSVRRGDLVAVRPGVLVRRDAIASFRADQRHLLLVRATAPLITPPRLISHASAAAIHGLPFVGPPPDKVQVTDPRRTRADASRYLRVHHGDGPGDHRRDASAAGRELAFFGAPVTTVARTLVDVAATTSLSKALPMVDAALHDGVVHATELIEELERARPKAHARARVALGMGSALSASPAESLARVRFRQVGAPEPLQQQEFSRIHEQRAVVDFWFPEQGVVVEIDGRAKYEDPEMLAGRSTADAHWREKQREDFVRSFAQVRSFVRLTWADLMDHEVIRAKLTRAGIPCR